MAEDEPRKRFLREIAKEASLYRWLSRWNQFGFGLLTFSSILSSFLAAILAAQNRPVDHTLVIVLSGLPAVLLSIIQGFDFNARAAYYDLAATKFDEIRIGVMFQELALAEAAAKRLKVSEELTARWAEILDRRTRNENFASVSKSVP
jgi:5'-deoxynucleotidase YfbR-like HD superfamily hydrolase